MRLRRTAAASAAARLHALASAAARLHALASKLRLMARLLQSRRRRPARGALIGGVECAARLNWALLGRKNRSRRALASHR